MKKRRTHWVIVASLLLFALGCKRTCEEPAEIQPKVRVVFHTVCGSQEIPSGGSYTRADGETFQVDLLKYYISHFALVNSVEDSLLLNDHTLIDPLHGKTSFYKSNGAEGKYQELRFILGVDSLHNHSGNQEGDLDPVNGMIWTWSTGYIFFKHEGTFDDSGTSSPLLYHYGQDRALVNLAIPAEVILEMNKEYEIHVELDLEKLYQGVLFSNNNVHQSAGSADAVWMNTLKANFANAFRFKEVKKI